MYTHEITKVDSNGKPKPVQRCYSAVWWPSEDPAIGSREKQWPLMVLESGQITRVNARNLKKIGYVPPMAQSIIKS